MRTTQLLVCIAACALAACHASASLIINGDFTAGNNGFSSAYEYTSAANGLSTGGTPSGGAQKYAVGTDPKFYHSSFVSFGDHTSGSGNMMIVNGSTSVDKNVWTGTLSASLVVGATYELSAWVRNVYAASPASLKFSVGGVQVGSDFSVTGTDAWHRFAATFVATASQTPTAVDLNLAYSGNDFALDDIALVPVPEPSTYVAGTLLLLPLGASTIRMLRKRRAT